MSSKGWVSRKREQFEQFARTQDETETRAQSPQVLSLVPSQEEKGGEMKVKIASAMVRNNNTVQAEELETLESVQREEKPADDPPEMDNFRSVAIRESSKPSGTRAKENKKIEPGVNSSSSSHNNNNNNNNNLVNLNTKPSSPLKVGLGRSLNNKQEGQQEVTRKVYSQYREMLRRYEQSSRL